MHIAYVGRHGIPANATGRMRWRTAIDAVLHDGSCGVDQRSRELIEASDARPHGLRVRSLSFVDAASVACCGGSLIRSYGGDSIESFSSESIILPDAMGSTYRASLCLYYSRSAVRSFESWIWWTFNACALFMCLIQADTPIGLMSCMMFFLFFDLQIVEICPLPYVHTYFVDKCYVP